MWSVQVYVCVVLLHVVISEHPCHKNFFSCDTNQCIPWKMRCNGIKDCADNSDEQNCDKNTCPDNYHRCDNGYCIDISWRCDGEEDCENGSDELECKNNKCPNFYFRCTSGACIYWTRRCDGESDCADGSDELGCAKNACPSNFHRCSNGQCIPTSWLCEGIHTCSDDPFQSYLICNNKATRSNEEKIEIETQLRTHNINDSMSYIFSLYCPNNYFRCDTHRCIPPQTVCDKVINCIDRTDELNCTMPCAKGFFTCGSGECVPDSLVCNNKFDCHDKSDEKCQYSKVMEPIVLPSTPSYSSMFEKTTIKNPQVTTSGWQLDNIYAPTPKSNIELLIKKYFQSTVQSTEGSYVQPLNSTMIANSSTTDANKTSEKPFSRQSLPTTTTPCLPAVTQKIPEPKQESSWTSTSVFRCICFCSVFVGIWVLGISRHHIKNLCRTCAC